MDATLVFLLGMAAVLALPGLLLILADTVGRTETYRSQRATQPSGTTGAAEYTRGSR